MIVPLTVSDQNESSPAFSPCMQEPLVVELNATADHYIITHITVLLIVLTAIKTGNKDKIYFVKKFLPSLYFCKRLILWSEIPSVVPPVARVSYDLPKDFIQSRQFPGGTYGGRVRRHLRR
jgi:hypothetical protein